MSEAKKTEYTPMQTLIRLVAAGARKERIDDLCVDWAAVTPLASEQHVLSLTACALLHSPELECPEKLREYLMNAMRSEASVQLIRRQRIMQLLAEMKAAGMEARILKGYAVAGYYAHPECRGSVDTDVLIDSRQEKQAVQFFEEHEFRVTPRSATSQHVVCQHRKYGVVELHVALYAELVRDIWFQGMDVAELTQEVSIEVNGPEGSFTTLGHTDQLIFLTLHMVKHFVLSGVTLRMMLDIALYFAGNRDQIDAKRYWALLEKLHYSKLVHCMLWNMIEYGGFCISDFPGICPEAPEEMQEILRDLEQGGYMGVKEEGARLESGMEYNHLLMRKSRSKRQYQWYMLVWKIKSAMINMFPPSERLKKMYPGMTRYRILFPAAWLWQAVSYPVKKVASGALTRDVRSDNRVLEKGAANRIEMFRKLDML